MIFKVYYQKMKNEVPVRERTDSMYVEADSEKDVRIMLADHDINVEFIQKVSGAHLEYEKQAENFKMETV
jgi:DNA-dependent RNA polymerase auxiliary subunit epsilon